jgi:hypothetical protein
MFAKIIGVAKPRTKEGYSKMIDAFLKLISERFKRKVR